MPLVSVCIPTCNRPSYLKRTLQCVRNQKFTDYEVIIINDGGCDISSIVKGQNDARIRIIVNDKRMGPSFARNTAIANAQGKYITYMDDDDVYYEDHLHTLVTYMREHEFVYSECTDVLEDENGVVLKKENRFYPPYHPSLIKRCNFIPIGGIMHRKDLIEKTGGFDCNISFGEDWELWIRCSRILPFHHIKKVTWEYRKRDSNHNRNNIHDAKINTRSINEIIWKKHSLIPNIRALYPDSVPDWAVEKLSAMLGDEKIFVYGAGTFFKQVYPSIKNNILGIFDANHAKLDRHFRDRYNLGVLPPEKLNLVNKSRILSTAVGNVRDVLITIYTFQGRVDNIIFLDDFLDQPN